MWKKEKSQKEWAMGAEPFAPPWPPPLMGMLSLLGTPPPKQMQLTLENLMRQTVMIKKMEEKPMPNLGASRLVEVEVVEFDVAESVMPEDVVATRIREADVVEGPMQMSMAISRDGLVVREDRCDDDIPADVLLMLSKMPAEVV